MMLTFPFNFLWVRGDRKSLESMDPGFMLTTGAWAGFCMLKNDLMLATSLSYELSANDRPFDASLQAAIHLAYCSSYMKYKRVHKTIDQIKSKAEIQEAFTYIIATNPHFTVNADSIIRWHFQFDIEFSLGQIYFRRNLAAT